MRKSLRLSCGAAIAAGCAVMYLAAPLSAQTQGARTATAKASSPARTPDGHPDLQGVWSFATLTPMDRPAEFKDKPVLSRQEAEAYARTQLERQNKDRRDGGGGADVGRAYNDFWWDYGKSATTRTSLVVDPPDGRTPALTAEAQQRLAAQGRLRQRPAEGPEDRSLGERCIMGFNAGPPVGPSARES